MAGTFLTDDLSAVFNTADFSVSVTHQPPAPAPAVTILGIFDDEDVEVEGDTGDRYIQASAKFTTATSNGVAIGDQLIIAGTTYLVRYEMNDGTGVTMFYLEDQT